MAWEVAFVLSVLLLLRAGVSRTLRWIHNRLNATRGLNTNIPYEASVFECMQRPLEFLSLFTVGTAFAEAVSRPLAAMGLIKHIMTLRELGIIFSATWFLLRWINRIKTRFAVDKRVDKAQVDTTSRIATVAVFVVSVLISLDTVGVNIQTVLAFGGIGGIAIGFAGREIISNFFGGFMIYITRPFSVGEWIRSIEERELNGTVEDIGWYLTRVRTWDKRPLYIPNSRFSTLIVENGSRMDNRRILHTLRLRHEDMPVVLNIVAEIENMLMSHPELDPRQHRLAYLDSFDEFSVKIWISCYTKSVFLYDFRRVQQDVLVKCHELVRAAGAKLATINTRDVRPGVDTDRYGPFGTLATFGSPADGIAVPEKISNVPPVNYDVPGARRYDPSDPVVTMHTIESGIDPSRYNQHVAPPTGRPVGEQTQSGKRNISERDLLSTKALSEAARAATAAAFLAAQRNSARRSEESASPVESSHDGGTTGGAEAPNPAGGQMKISRAPPRSESMESSSQAVDSATEAKPAHSTTNAQMKISRAPPWGDGQDGGLVDKVVSDANADSRVPHHAAPAQMKISRAPPRMDGSESSAPPSNEGSQAAAPVTGQMKISRAPPRADSFEGTTGSAVEPKHDSRSPAAQQSQTRTSRNSPGSDLSDAGGVSGADARSEHRGNGHSATGQMKISRAPPRKDSDDIAGDLFDLNKTSTDGHEKQGPPIAKHAEKSATSHGSQKTAEHPSPDKPGHSLNGPSGV